MPRISRIVVPHYPHHVIQRGNRRQKVFFSSKDKELYMDLIKEFAFRKKMQILAYCLMDNHVHFVVIPEREDSLAKAFGEAHRRYTRKVNMREDWRGYLWQGRFSSYVLNEPYLYAAVRYVEQNPVRAGLIEKAEDYAWSSARYHVFGIKDFLVKENFIKKDMIEDWRDFLRQEEHPYEKEAIRKHAKTGRPLGDDTFLKKIQKITGRKDVFPGQTGRKRRKLEE